jgi:type I restriction enzyme S subunit
MERVEEVEGLNLSIRKDATQLPMAFRYDLWETCSKQYSPQELGAVVSSTKNGLYKPAKYHGSGSILLRMFNINGAGFDNTKIVRMQVTSKEAEDYYICNGDIIVSRVNSRELVGKSCLVQGLNEAAVHEAMLIRLRVDERVVDQRFLVWLINSPQFLHDLRNRAKHAIGQSSINQKDLLTSKIPLPYLAHQKDLVSQNESFAPLAIAIQNEVAEQEKASLNLRESILRKAFAGEL